MADTPPAKPEWDEVAADWLSAVALSVIGAGLLAAAGYFGLHLILQLAGKHEPLTLSALGLQTLLIVLVGVFGAVMLRRGASNVRRLLRG